MLTAISPSFKSRIIISNNAFNSLPLDKMSQEGLEVGGSYTLEDSKYIPKEGFTQNACGCTCGVIKSDKSDEFYLFHIKTSEDKRKIEKTIRLIAEKFKKEDKKAQLSAILVGGNKDYYPSKQNYNFFLNLFDRLGIKYSALLGQTKREKYLPSASLYYSRDRDEFVIGQKDTSTKNNAKNVSDLKDRFETVIIGECDSINFA